MISTETRSMSPKKLRYRLYRIMNGSPVDPSDGVREYFEALNDFGGWENFAITWDVCFPEEPTDKKPWEIKVVNESLFKRHNLVDAKKTRKKG